MMIEKEVAMYGGFFFCFWKYLLAICHKKFIKRLAIRAIEKNVHKL